MTTSRRPDPNHAVRNRRIRTISMSDELRALADRRRRATDGYSGLFRRALCRYFSLMDHVLHRLAPDPALVRRAATAFYDPWLRGELGPFDWVNAETHSEALTNGDRARMRRWTLAERAAVLDLLERAWLLGADVLGELD